MSTSRHQYQKVEYESSSQISDEENVAFLHPTQPQKSGSRRWQRPSIMTIVPWALTAVFATLYISTYANSASEREYGSFEKGFATEFEGAKPHIELELRRFTSGVLFTPEGEPYRTPYPDIPTYVGPPSQELDENWEKLIGSRYFSVTDEEAEAIADSENKKTWDKHKDWGFLSGFDMLHSLHCVNMVRKGLDGDYYYPEYDMEQHHSRNHLDHCLDHLREYVMCHGDLTPLTTVYWPQIDASFAHSEQWHVCRKYQPLREYATSRFNGSDAVVKLSKERLTAGKGQGRLAEGGHCPGCLPDSPGS